MDKQRLAVLIKKGPEVYYKDKENPVLEVEAAHPNAERAERHGGELLIQIEEDTPVWVTWGHVRAVEAPGARRRVWSGVSRGLRHGLLR